MNASRSSAAAGATAVIALQLLAGCAGTPGGGLPPVTGPGQTPATGPAAGVEIQPLDPAGSVQQRPITAGPSPGAPARSPQTSNPAVLALLDSAGQQVASGDLERAAATLERALRIDPEDAGIWHDLGELRYRQGQYQQAESLAARSNALATGDAALQARNWRLIERVRRALGNTLGADEAAAQALLLQRR